MYNKDGYISILKNINEIMTEIKITETKVLKNNEIL